MKTPVLIALICLFCSFLFSGWSQLEYERPVSSAPLSFPYASSAGLKTLRVKLPGCAALTKKEGMSDFALYKASHPPLIDFTYPEALASQPILKTEARRCFGDVYYVRVFNTSAVETGIPASVLKMLKRAEGACWVPVDEMEPAFQYTPIISTIPLNGEVLPEE